MKNIVRSIAVLLVVIGSINWGLIGLFDFNLIHTLSGGLPGVITTMERVLYVAYGIAGLLLAYYEIEGCKCDGRDC